MIRAKTPLLIRTAEYAVWLEPGTSMEIIVWIVKVDSPDCLESGLLTEVSTVKYFTGTHVQDTVTKIKITDVDTG